MPQEETSNFVSNYGLRGESTVCESKKKKLSRANLHCGTRISQEVQTWFFHALCR